MPICYSRLRFARPCSNKRLKHYNGCYLLVYSPFAPLRVTSLFHLPTPPLYYILLKHSRETIAATFILFPPSLPPPLLSLYHISIAIGTSWVPVPTPVLVQPLGFALSGVSASRDRESVGFRKKAYQDVCEYIFPYES
ncbi:hypothetical protein BDV36DRAFT_78576 [Aspergillus pseudocaelatus]|uniref:Uncharacterized protein n=1 Tax=Aspergillus pseudocaelatus TaxID=1825620 RepID=A0ABQ6W8F1_9EURO|nr:hypothetical protein BDV36DRAFT_78576 [Aspergillus pseudocaelatus]